ncbi:unnamed protein product [Lactuca saligna]|uniref:Acetolactate synthase small subunit-like ACT domain-containing protein n=1 Tax=Lactuca saligna TaxID=75948 RepID=A0AA36DYD6_LACSI|nr:unnamed protein product [Lactuca saligna]
MKGKLGKNVWGEELVILAEASMEPAVIYVKQVFDIISKASNNGIKGIAHIPGGGFMITICRERMDMAVNCKPGEAYNQVVEVDVKVEEPGKDNVHNNAFYTQETLFKSESQAMRDCNLLSARHWILTGHKSHTVNILVNNAPGVLNLVNEVISRKGYNIQESFRRGFMLWLSSSIHLPLFLMITCGRSPLDIFLFASHRFLLAIVNKHQKVINGSGFNCWACINFSRIIPDGAAHSYCHQLVQMCQESGMCFFHGCSFLEIDLGHLKVTNEVSWHGPAEDQASVHRDYFLGFPFHQLSCHEFG